MDLVVLVKASLTCSADGTIGMILVTQRVFSCNITAVLDMISGERSSRKG